MRLTFLLSCPHDGLVALVSPGVSAEAVFGSWTEETYVRFPRLGLSSIRDCRTELRQVPEKRSSGEIRRSTDNQNVKRDE